MDHMIPENDPDDPLNGVSFAAVPTKGNDDNTDTHGYSPAHTHMKTYTAGEDNSRLANAAKELGLSMQQARQPRKQVRQLKAKSSGGLDGMLNHTAAVVQHLFLDTSFEDARMRAIYSAHSRYVEEEDDDYTQGLFRTSLPEYQMATVLEEEGKVGDEVEGGPAVDAHGVEVGGDLVSACTGTYHIWISYYVWRRRGGV
jgi:hypothetical protein